jgi:hypothetical protein
MCEAVANVKGTARCRFPATALVERLARLRLPVSGAVADDVVDVLSPAGLWLVAFELDWASDMFGRI